MRSRDGSRRETLPRRTHGAASSPPSRGSRRRSRATPRRRLRRRGPHDAGSAPGPSRHDLPAARSSASGAAPLRPPGSCRVRRGVEVERGQRGVVARVPLVADGGEVQVRREGSVDPASAVTVTRAFASPRATSASRSATHRVADTDLRGGRPGIATATCAAVAARSPAWSSHQRHATTGRPGRGDPRGFGADDRGVRGTSLVSCPAA